jgi:hypothetical protein
MKISERRTVPQAVFDSREALRAAREGHRQACEELARTPCHLLGEGNPNHPRYDWTLFGYDEREFLAKQYQ